MAESIKFYKLHSPYPEDVTKGCMLTTADIDANSLAFKNADISAATFDCESYILDIIRNDGERLSADMSCLKGHITEEIEQKIAEIVPGVSDIKLDGYFTEDGSLTLSYETTSGTSVVTIEGLKEVSDVIHDPSMFGVGSKKDPLGISDLELTGYHKNVIDVVDVLPTAGVSKGDMYVTSGITSSFGTLYDKQGMECIKSLIDGSIWRVPTIDDWNALIEYSDACGSENLSGKMLKSKDVWTGNLNTDHFGFSVYPTGKATSDYSLLEFRESAYIWTSTPVSGESESIYVLKFSSNKDSVEFVESEDDAMYSIRLVASIDDVRGMNIGNIFGDRYELVELPEINQVWIKTNLSYDKYENHSFTPSYSGIPDIVTKNYICRFSGTMWERRMLDDGDMFTAPDNGTTWQYMNVLEDNGNYHIVRFAGFQKSATGNIVIDAGWY
jgi:uncharacterized protein (TIGR02145 family)